MATAITRGDKAPAPTSLGNLHGACGGGLRGDPVEERTERHAEEAEMQMWWLPFDEAVEAVFAGRVGDALTVGGLLALHALRTRA